MTRPCAHRLGVEVKMDARWTPAQLTSTINNDDDGVLLAVGYTALAATQPELPCNWRLVRPAEWTTIAGFATLAIVLAGK